MREEVAREGTTNTAPRDQALGGLYLLSEAHILLMASVVEAASSCGSARTTSISCWWGWVPHAPTCQGVLHFCWTDPMVALCALSTQGRMGGPLLWNRWSWCCYSCWLLVGITTYHQNVALPVDHLICWWMQHLDISCDSGRWMACSWGLVLVSHLVVIYNARLLQDAI